MLITAFHSASLRLAIERHEAVSRAAASAPMVPAARLL
jgi:hypothetical protein